MKLGQHVEDIMNTSFLLNENDEFLLWDHHTIDSGDILFFKDL